MPCNNVTQAFVPQRTSARAKIHIPRPITQQGKFKVIEQYGASCCGFRRRAAQKQARVHHKSGAAALFVKAKLGQSPNITSPRSGAVTPGRCAPTLALCAAYEERTPKRQHSKSSSKRSRTCRQMHTPGIPLGQVRERGQDQTSALGKACLGAANTHQSERCLIKIRVVVL